MGFSPQWRVPEEFHQTRDLMSLKKPKDIDVTVNNKVVRSRVRKVLKTT